jgi:hypothetical protein
MRAPWTALAVIAVLGCAPAVAQQPTAAQQDALRSNCRGDAQSFCSGMRGGDALRCLQTNVAKLSPGCQTAVRAVSPPPAPAAAPAPAPAAPRPAAAPAPAVVPPAVATPQPAASPATAPPASPPRAAAPAAPPAPPTPQQQAAIKQACQSDFMARCRGVKTGGPEALQCLQRNAAQVSPACRQALAATGGAPAPAAARPAPAPAAAAPPPAAAAPAAPTPVVVVPTSPLERMSVARACTADRDVHCKLIPPGDGRIVVCLMQHEPALTPTCKAALAKLRR